MKPAPKPEPALVDEDARSFIRSLRCIACAKIGLERFHTEACHVRTKRNAGDYQNLVPLCHHHHVHQHLIGVKSFAKIYALDLEQIAKGLWDYYEARERLSF